MDARVFVEWVGVCVPTLTLDPREAEGVVCMSVSVCVCTLRGGMERRQEGGEGATSVHPPPPHPQLCVVGSGHLWRPRGLTYCAVC